VGPARRWEIFVLESSRLWNYWLGLPVPPRAWKFRLPKNNRQSQPIDHEL